MVYDVSWILWLYLGLAGFILAFVAWARWRKGTTRREDVDAGPTHAECVPTLDACPRCHTPLKVDALGIWDDLAGKKIVKGEHYVTSEKEHVFLLYLDDGHVVKILDPDGTHVMYDAPWSLTS